MDNNDQDFQGHENYTPEGVQNPEIYKAAVSCLRGCSQSNPMQVRDLIKCVATKLSENAGHGGAAVKEYLIYRDLNSASKDGQSRIASRKGAGGGYFLAAPPSDTDVATFETQQAQAQERTLEKHIWPAVELWLREQKEADNACCGVANKKGGGVWSNPDVVGISVIEGLGFFDVEITTVEVKPNASNWRYYIFEAVAHKRVSDRVYFLFRTSGSSPADLQDILRYAEKYRIGIVEFQVSDADFARLPQWGALSDEDRPTFVESFVEHMPAPLDPIPIRDKLTFLRQIGIRERSDFYKFGSGLLK